jgi:hypothetical protein
VDLRIIKNRFDAWNWKVKANERIRWLIKNKRNIEKSGKRINNWLNKIKRIVKIIRKRIDWVGIIIYDKSYSFIKIKIKWRNYLIKE